MTHNFGIFGDGFDADPSRMPHDPFLDLHGMHGNGGMPHSNFPPHDSMHLHDSTYWPGGIDPWTGEYRPEGHTNVYTGVYHPIRPKETSSLGSPWWGDACYDPAMENSFKGLVAPSFFDPLENHSEPLRPSSKKNAPRAAATPDPHYTAGNKPGKEYAKQPTGFAAMEDVPRSNADRPATSGAKRKAPSVPEVSYEVPKPKPVQPPTAPVRISEFAPNADGVFVEVKTLSWHPLDHGRPFDTSGAGHGGGGEPPHTSGFSTAASPEPERPLPSGFAERASAAERHAAAEIVDESFKLSRGGKIVAIGGAAALTLAATGYAAHRLHQKQQDKDAPRSRT